MGNDVTHILWEHAQIEPNDFPMLRFGKLHTVTSDRKYTFVFLATDMVVYSLYEKLYSKLFIAFCPHIVDTINIVFQYPNDVQQHLHTNAENIRGYVHQFFEEHKKTLKILHTKRDVLVLERTISISYAPNAYDYEQLQKVLPLLEQFLTDKGFSDIRLVLKEEDVPEEHYYEDTLEAIERSEEEAITNFLVDQRVEKTAKEDKETESSNTLEKRFNRIKYDQVTMEKLSMNESFVTHGYIFFKDVRLFKNGGGLLQLKLTDYTDSIIAKLFANRSIPVSDFDRIQKGDYVKIAGKMEFDNFSNEMVMNIEAIRKVHRDVKTDPALEKRIELHAHTTMSTLNATQTADQLAKRMKAYGHEAGAITDHYNVQSYPDFERAMKSNGIKPMYGLEATCINQIIRPVLKHEFESIDEHQTFVIFDIETTGLSPVYNKIIEIGAVKVRNGQIIDRFAAFVNPHMELSTFTMELTHIRQEDVDAAEDIHVVLNEFYTFSKDAIYVAHNAPFDVPFIQYWYKKCDITYDSVSAIDTLELARYIYPELGRHGLAALNKKFKLGLEGHHRADADAAATANFFLMCLKEIEKKGIQSLEELDRVSNTEIKIPRGQSFHITLLVQTQEGLKNLFKIVSESHTKTFASLGMNQGPRVLRSFLDEHREGLLFGASGCLQGEIITALQQESDEEVKKRISYYDYIEIMPKSQYYELLSTSTLRDERELEEMLLRLMRLSKEVGVLCVAVGNTHFLDRHEYIYKKILNSSQMAPARLQMNETKYKGQFFRTTQEMLEEFSFIVDQNERKNIVIFNTHQIAHQIDDITIVKKELYTPNLDGEKIDGAIIPSIDDRTREMTYERAHELYGEKLPKIVEDRLEKELQSIIGHGFAVIYFISHLLVKRSNKRGYLVGSRGSIGSSLVATMMGITEVNPLPPHYICPTCYTSEFITDGSVASGFDLPKKECACGTHFKREGQDIPFETFLGFKGDKVPDIDLNFSGVDQPYAHLDTRDYFGNDHVYRAGTISTVAEKTAYGYVRGYLNDYSIEKRTAEIDRLTFGCSGIKRTTGQHPGGIIVVPKELDIHDFTPIQYPADDLKSEWRTTHFDFHSIHDNVLKLDILGHDDPTMIRKLELLTGIDAKTIDPADEKVCALFASPQVLGVTEEEILCVTGTLGVPEFGTRFVIEMLKDTKPTTFGELVQISGLSHGTDVWLNNAADLIRNHTCTLKDVIGCRDDIMVYLIYQGLPEATAFQIMESVRKGKGLTEEWKEIMRSYKVPEWYIDSCEKIKYMFPKAHAAAYVLMAMRIAYFKVYYPLEYYAAYFSERASDFEIRTMMKGKNALYDRVKELMQRIHELTNKEKNVLTVLQIALEMTMRGFTFGMISIEHSESTEFKIDYEHKMLLPSFIALDGLGENVALRLVEERERKAFTSVEDMKKRTGLSKTIITELELLGVLKDMSAEDQMSLF